MNRLTIACLLIVGLAALFAETEAGCKKRSCRNVFGKRCSATKETKCKNVCVPIYGGYGHDGDGDGWGNTDGHDKWGHDGHDGWGNDKWGRVDGMDKWGHDGMDKWGHDGGYDHRLGHGKLGLGKLGLGKLGLHKLGHGHLSHGKWGIGSKLGHGKFGLGKLGLHGLGKFGHGLGHGKWGLEKYDESYPDDRSWIVGRGKNRKRCYNKCTTIRSGKVRCVRIWKGRKCHCSY